MKLMSLLYLKYFIKFYQCLKVFPYSMGSRRQNNHNEKYNSNLASINQHSSISTEQMFKQFIGRLVLIIHVVIIHVKIRS